MPELPEVETVVRSVVPHILGKQIRRAEFYSRRVTRSDFSAAAQLASNAAIRDVRRRGKQIWVELSNGSMLYIHLGMTGKLLWNATPGKYTRALFEFDHGVLLYDDVRQFGRVELYDHVPDALRRAGPDALDMTFDDFYTRLKKRRGSIKALLLNQSFIAGVGNIYADESLFAAGIHPRADIQRLSKKRVESLYQHLTKILRLAIRHRGSSISDYVDTAGNSGEFQSRHKVYARNGESCVRCGKPIRRIVLAQRGTHYCPRCQRV